MSTSLIEIKNLHVNVDGAPILKGIDLTIAPGEVHAIMGPNGSGKSTLAKVIAGHPSYEVTEGQLLYNFDGKSIDLAELEPHERAQAGLFLGMQYPIEVAGVSNLNFLRESFNEVCKAQGIEQMDVYDFKNLISDKMNLLDMKTDFLHRSVNTGFSGGEKKKNEILQLLVLNPRLAVLDETDSGLDVDALKIVSKGVNTFKSRFNATLLITHYQRLLNYIVPDRVHILQDGKIVESGGAEVALKVENEGYEAHA